MTRVTAPPLVIHGILLPRHDGALSAPHDIEIEHGHVTAVHPAGRHPRTRTIDGGGRIALPGLIDAHSHAGAAVFDPQVQHALLRQGVTSVVVGQDGIGPAPADDATSRWAARYFAAIDGTHPRFAGGTVRDLLATYDGTTAVNVATTVPHGTLRHQVLGAAPRPATPDETAQMAHLASIAFDDGAVGLSTGLEYVPAAWADESELVALAEVAARHGLPHVSHMRGYESAAGSGLDELVRIARATGVATHVAHLHGPLDLIEPRLTAARDAGIDLTFDSYPYLRGFSLLSMVALPTWLPLADPEACLAALAEPGVLARLHAEHLDALGELWPRITLAGLPTDRDHGPAGAATGLGAGLAAGHVAGVPAEGDDLGFAAGLRLLDVAARWGVRPADAAVRILVATGLRASCVFEQPPTGSAQSVSTLLDHPAHVAGSDAIYVPWDGGHPHPRGWGAFTRLLSGRVLGRCTDLDDGAGTGEPTWSWADAVEHLSARAARLYRLADRGSLAPGSVADIVLVDPESVRDHATFAEPRRLAGGIDDVVVAGVPVLVDGGLTGATPGRGLRPARPGRPAAPARPTRTTTEAHR